MAKSSSNTGVIFDEKLVKLNLQAQSRDDALEQLGSLLVQRGYVNGNYVEAIIRREEEYPTGIQTESFGVAIPHTDKEYVRQASIAVAVLAEPVVFGEMGTDEELEVNMIFMLAIKEPDDQLAMLQRLVEVFQDANSLKNIYNAQTKSEIVAIINYFFKGYNLL